MASGVCGTDVNLTADIRHTCQLIIMKALTSLMMSWCQEPGEEFRRGGRGGGGGGRGAWGAHCLLSCCECNPGEPQCIMGNAVCSRIKQLVDGRAERHAEEGGSALSWVKAAEETWSIPDIRWSCLHNKRRGCRNARQFILLRSWINRFVCIMPKNNSKKYSELMLNSLVQQSNQIRQKFSLIS